MRYLAAGLDTGVNRPGKPVQRANVPLAHFLFPLHPDEFVNLRPLPPEGSALSG